MNPDAMIIQEAKRLTRRGYQAHMAGEVTEAISSYQQSIETYPTAEAYTLLGWAYSMQGHFEDAITECNRAIALDPTLGNPYNDIGTYLVALGRPLEAEHYFESATLAPNYENRAAPYMNLAKLYRARNDHASALSALRSAVSADPRNIRALDYLHLEVARWN